jgi:DNA modification methylase
METIMPKPDSGPTISTECRRGPGAIEIIFRPLSELKLNPNNPKKHTARQLRQLAESMRALGFNVPVLTDANLQVVAGHGRVLAADLLGLDEVPTICLAHLSEAQARAFAIADNRLSEVATWDDRLLAEQLKALSLVDLDFNIEITGFELGEIDLRIASLDAEAATEVPTEAQVEPASGPPVSSPGDLWVLGNHRVMYGNVLDMAALEILMGEERAAMVFTDPPYNVRIEGHATGLGNIHHRPFAMATGEMSPPAFSVFLARSLRNQAAFCFRGALLYACMDWRHMSELLAAGCEIEAELLNLCVWVKDNGGMGSLYRSQHELVFVFKTGSGPHRNNVQLGRFGRNRSNVWRYPGANSFSRKTDEGNLLELHPTVKPVALVADAILDCTARGDIVLDGFLGSGTTVIAAERTGRRCYGLELDGRYVDTTIRRWQKLTGDTARHEVTGRTFADLEREVEAANAR